MRDARNVLKYGGIWEIYYVQNGRANLQRELQYVFTHPMQRGEKPRNLFPQKIALQGLRGWR